MQKKIEIAREEASLSLEELRGQRLELLPDRIELHRRHGRKRRHRNGGAHSVNICGGSDGGYSGGVSGDSF